MEPTEVSRCVFFLVHSPFYPGCGVVGGWLGRGMSLDDCWVRGPFFCGLAYYGAHGEVIVGDCCSHTQRTSQFKYPCLR